MIKKLLLYVVFAIPSLVFGFCMYMYNYATVWRSSFATIVLLVLTYCFYGLFALGKIDAKPQTTENISPLSGDSSENELQTVKIISEQRISKRIDGYRITYQGTDEELAKLQHSMLKNPLYMYDSWLWSTEHSKPTLTVTYYERSDR